MRAIDMTGQTFGKLKVLHKAPSRKTSGGHIKSRWVCECACGNIVEVDGCNLRKGVTKSCGCLAHQTRKEYIDSLRKKNKFELYNEKGYGIGWTTNSNKIFYFDLEDYDKIKNQTWFEYPPNYVSNTKCDVLMHRLVTNCPEGKVVDHMNHNTMDNRKDNLRVCCQSQNCINRKKSSRNSSGYKGVSWDKQRNLWVAAVNHNYKKYYLGGFETAEKAYEAYKKKAKELFGEFYFDDHE